MRCLRLLGALVLLCAGCGTGVPPVPPFTPGTAEARFSIHLDEPHAVDRLLVEVLAQGAPLAPAFELSRMDGAWSGALPSLPVDEPLTFFARAHDATGALRSSGSTDQQLSQASEQVIIGLAPPGPQASLPRIKRITVPGELRSGHGGGNISVTVEGNPGERLAWSFITGPASPSGGGFLPATGTLTLLGAAGTFVSHYVPPTVTAKTHLVHTVRVTNEAGQAVTATFRAQVKPGTEGGALDTAVTALFNPVIHALDGQRLQGTSDVLFTAAVSDDGPTDALAYAWSFQSEGTYDPMPSLSAQANPATLRHYTPAVRGLLRLAVTDATGGTTTLEYRLTPGQFPDDLVQPP
jgi:hypothetical protein